MNTASQQTRLACFFLVLCFLFSGCTPFQSSTQDLMRPPTLTQEQAEIQNALTLAVGSNDIKYRYPQNGEYRSSFIFYDIDGDQAEEALVFYQSNSKGSGIWLNILDQQPDGSWASVFETSAPRDSTVDFVSFEKLVTVDSINIVIGWEDDRQGKNVIVYSYRDRKLDQLFSREYSELSITDLDNNGTSDMVLLQNESRHTQVFLACQVEEEFKVVHAIPINREISSFAKVTAGKISAAQNALFLDENIERNGVTYQITDVISAVQTEDTPELVNLLDHELSALSEQTLRPQQDLFCRDADGDGLIEIPSFQYLPGYESLSSNDLAEGDIMILTAYNALQDGALIPRLQGVVNTSHRYMVLFPEKWIGKVTVVSQPENGEWTFLKYQDSLADTSLALLRIRVYSTKDYHDKFENDYFKLIEKKGLFEYYAYIPPTTDDLRITEGDLTGSGTEKGMFVFIE